MNRPGHGAKTRASRTEILRDRWRMWYGDRGPVWHFGLKFGGCMALFYLLVLTPLCDRLLYAYLEANAWLANGVLQGLGLDTHVADNTIRSARFALTIRRGCDAIEPSWLFCAALVSFPAPLRKKILGALAGAALLQALNLVRIVSLWFIGLNQPAWFKAAHLEIWPVVFILVAICLWIGWARWTMRPAPHAIA